MRGAAGSMKTMEKEMFDVDEGLYFEVQSLREENRRLREDNQKLLDHLLIEHHCQHDLIKRGDDAGTDNGSEKS